MLMQHTLTQLKALKLDGMARAFEEQSTLTASISLSFEERVGMLVDRELAWRDTRRLERLLRAAKLQNPQACVEDIEYRQRRGLDQRIVATLAGCDWVRNAQNLPHGRGQDVARMRVRPVGVPSGLLGVPGARRTAVRSTENRARRRQLHTPARATREDRCADPRRLGLAGSRPGRAQ